LIVNNPPAPVVKIRLSPATVNAALVVKFADVSDTVCPVASITVNVPRSSVVAGAMLTVMFAPLPVSVSDKIPPAVTFEAVMFALLPVSDKFPLAVTFETAIPDAEDSVTIDPEIEPLPTVVMFPLVLVSVTFPPVTDSPVFTVTVVPLNATSSVPAPLPDANALSTVNAPVDATDTTCPVVLSVNCPAFPGSNLLVLNALFTCRKISPALPDPPVPTVKFPIVVTCTGVPLAPMPPPTALNLTVAPVTTPVPPTIDVPAVIIALPAPAFTACDNVIFPAVADKVMLFPVLFTPVTFPNVVTVKASASVKMIVPLLRAAKSLAVTFVKLIVVPALADKFDALMFPPVSLIDPFASRTIVPPEVAIFPPLWLMFPAVAVSVIVPPAPAVTSFATDRFPVLAVSVTTVPPVVTPVVDPTTPTVKAMLLVKEMFPLPVLLAANVPIALASAKLIALPAVADRFAAVRIPLLCVMFPAVAVSAMVPFDAEIFPPLSMISPVVDVSVAVPFDAEIFPPL